MWMQVDARCIEIIPIDRDGGDYYIIRASFSYLSMSDDLPGTSI